MIDGAGRDLRPILILQMKRFAVGGQINLHIIATLDQRLLCILGMI